MKQLTCPKCRYEFSYDNAYYDYNIARLSADITTIKDQLAAHNLKSWEEQRRNTDWWLRAKKALTEKQKQLTGLKAFRKMANEQVQHAKNKLFRQAVRDLFGEQAYVKCCEETEKYLEAYRLSDLAKTEYSHKHGKGVTGISKI